MTQIGVKTRRMRNLYVLVVFAPRSRTNVLRRRVSRREHPRLSVGDTFRVRGRQLRVRRIARRIERSESVIEHVTEIFTILASPRCVRKALPNNVMPMPFPDSSVVAEFLRYHVLVRVFDGDPDAWLAALRERGGDDGDVRFVRWIRSRLRRDPALIVSIRRMVDATPFWRASQVST